jgi:ribonuclease VapC
VILDGSAVITLLLGGPGHERLAKRLSEADWVGMPAPAVVETAMVLSSRLRPSGKALVERFLDEAEIEVIDFTAQHWTCAADAFLRYGKGRHPAQLNFGECMSYAAGKLADMPLLFIGDDFSQTDIRSALEDAPDG